MSAENTTLMDGLLEDNPFADMMDEKTLESERTLNQAFEVIHFLFEVVKLLVCATTFVGDIYLITILIRFKQLRNRINNLILAYVIFTFLYLVLSNLILMIIVSLGSYTDLSYCLTMNMDHLMITCSYYTITFMVIDWYVSNYHSVIYKEKFPRFFKYGLGITFAVLAIAKWMVSSIVCGHGYWPLYTFVKYTLEGVTYGLCSISLISIGILKRIYLPRPDTYKTEYVFTISKAVFLLALPLYILQLFEFFAWGDISWSWIRWAYILEKIGECFFVSQTIVVLYLLGKSNKYFQMAYLKCCKKRVKEYDDDDLDTDSVHESQDNDVRFNKNSEVIRF